jgi:zinc-finger-containing domain
MPKHTPIKCPYCGQPAERVTGAALYPHRPDVAQRIYWRCPGECRAWVGSHPGTDVPLGCLANAELRKWKRKAHDAFDPLWRTNGGKNKRAKARSRGYAALAKVLGIAPQDCHIGAFDLETCKRVLSVLPEVEKELAQNV